MISVDEAAALVTSHKFVAPCALASLDHLEAAVLAEDLRADRAYPAVHRVMMDGIALSYSAWAAGRREFPVRGTVAAGDEPGRLEDPDACVEIMTGAGLPEGADLIVPYEEVELIGGRAHVAEGPARTPMQYVHRLGSDFAPGDTLLRRGQVLQGPRWGIAASIGAHAPSVERFPRVKIISTGDELVAVTKEPRPHQVRRSNAYALRASLLSRGFTHVSLDHLRDDPAALRAHYEAEAPGHDLMLYSGGVSRGKFDYLPKVWAEAGVERIFHRVAQRPGKPLWFGVDSRKGTRVFGLPGNPVSSLVCLHRYVLADAPRYARLTRALRGAAPLTAFVPVRLRYDETGVTHAEPHEIKNSGEFAGLGESDGFAELPSARETYAAGDPVRIFLWEAHG